MNELPVDVLVVEDDPHDAEMILESLDPKLRIQRVRDGVKAVEVLFDSDPPLIPRIILLDLKLPRIGGLELLIRIRAEERTKIIPVVIFTSSAMEADINKAFEHGANSYVVKPPTYEAFTEAVRKIGRFWLETNLSAKPQ